MFILMELIFRLAMIDDGYALAYLKYPFSKYKVKELERLVKEDPKSYLGYWNYAEFLSFKIDTSINLCLCCEFKLFQLS